MSIIMDGAAVDGSDFISLYSSALVLPEEGFMSTPLTSYPKSLLNNERQWQPSQQPETDGTWCHYTSWISGAQWLKPRAFPSVPFGPGNNLYGPCVLRDVNSGMGDAVVQPGDKGCNWLLKEREKLFFVYLTLWCCEHRKRKCK